jgi:hypothetical protein
MQPANPIRNSGAPKAAIKSKPAATLKAIKLQDGRNIEESRRIVDDSDIDEKGFLKSTNR